MNTKESNVARLLEQLKREKTYKSRREQGKDQRATTMISEYDYRRLKFIAAQLGVLRSTFIRKVLIEALNDAEAVLNLQVNSSEVDEHLTELLGEPIFEMTDYGKYLHESRSDEEDDDDSDSDNDSESEDTKPKRPALKNPKGRG